MRNRDTRRDGRDETRDYKRRTTAAATHARETHPFHVGRERARLRLSDVCCEVGSSPDRADTTLCRWEFTEDVKFGVESVEFDAAYISGSNRICSLRRRPIPREPAPPPRRVSCPIRTSSLHVLQYKLTSLNATCSSTSFPRTRSRITRAMKVKKRDEAVDEYSAEHKRRSRWKPP